MSEEKDIWQADDGRPMCRHGGRSHSLNLACPTDDCEIGERHPKWQRVEPGTVIPAGQPYRTESRSGLFDDGATSCEFGNGQPEDLKVDALYDGAEYTMRVDSSWKPPLVLPTEPTWGIAVHDDLGLIVGQWYEDGAFLTDDDGKQLRRERIIGFTTLTDEQIHRIEAAR